MKGILKKKPEEIDEQQLNAEAEAIEPKDAKKHKIISTIVNVILVIAIVIAATATYTSYVSTSGNGVPTVLGLRVFSIQTDSMYPTLNPGDLIIDKAVKDSSQLQVGDIITYWTVINGERVLNTHRISQIYDGGGHLIFETKGDNNSISDSLTVHESEVVGIYSSRIAGVGKVFDYLQTSTGFLIVVVVPVFLFFLYYLIQFFRVLFEYQNVKNRIKYEQERGRTEDLIDAEKRKQEESHKAERQRIEAELREKLKAEMAAEEAKAAAESAAAEEVRRMIESSLRPHMEERSLRLLLETAIAGANRAVYTRSGQSGGALTGMGSTLCAAVVSDGTALVANVGDSRCYLLRQGELTQVTEDHTAVAVLLRQGLLSPEEAAHHPDRHAITRAIGVEPEVQPDYTVIDLLRGDALLLCSDGLYNALPPGELAGTLQEILRGGDIHTLIAKANAAGGPDNITAVLIHNR